MAMNWDDLRIFHAIARAGSLTAAAARLDVNQSTVSRRLATLEALVGARLVNRRAGGISLTAAGTEMLARADRVAEECDLIDRRLAGRDARLTGRLRVTCTDSFFNFFLAPHCARFVRLHPGIDLDVITGYQHLSLARREADVAIRTTLKPPETLVGRRLFRFALALYGARDFVAALPPNPDLAALPWIGWTSEAYNRLMIYDHFPEANIRHRGESQVDIASMVRSGLGVAVGGCFFVDADPELRRVTPDPVADAAMDLWVLTHADLARVARVRAFAGFIADAFLAERALFEGRRPLAFADA